MRSLTDKIIVGSSTKEKKQLLKEIDQWMGKNFILNFNQVRLPKEPNLEIMDSINAETPILEEFKNEGLTGNHYLIASLLSMGMEIGKKEKERELIKEIKMLQAQVDENNRKK